MVDVVIDLLFAGVLNLTWATPSGTSVKGLLLIFRLKLNKRTVRGSILIHRGLYSAHQGLNDFFETVMIGEVKMGSCVVLVIG